MPYLLNDVPVCDDCASSWAARLIAEGDTATARALSQTRFTASALRDATCSWCHRLIKGSKWSPLVAKQLQGLARSFERRGDFKTAARIRELLGERRRRAVRDS